MRAFQRPHQETGCRLWKCYYTLPIPLLFPFSPSPNCALFLKGTVPFPVFLRVLTSILPFHVPPKCSHYTVLSSAFLIQRSLWTFYIFPIFSSSVVRVQYSIPNVPFSFFPLQDSLSHVPALVFRVQYSFFRNPSSVFPVQCSLFSNSSLMFPLQCSAFLQMDKPKEPSAVLGIV